MAFVSQILFSFSGEKREVNSLIPCEILKQFIFAAELLKEAKPLT